MVPNLVANKVDSLERGPYLQLGTDTSVVVRWRSDIPVTSRVVYGTSIGNLTTTVQNLVPKLEHELTLTGLTPNTTYYFVVRARDEAGNRDNNSVEQSAATLSGPDTNAPNRTRNFMTTPRSTAAI